MNYDDKTELCERIIDDKMFAKVCNQKVAHVIIRVRALLDKECPYHETLALYLLLGILQVSTQEYNAEEWDYSLAKEAWLQKNIEQVKDVLEL